MHPVFTGLASLLLVLWATGAHTAPASLILSQPLRANPDLMAPAVARLPADTQVEVLGRQGGWTRVRAGGMEGWLRILALRDGLPSLPSAQNVVDLFRVNPGAGNRVTAVAGFRGLPPPRPSAHALILGIAEYGQGIPRLAGVARDMESALLMARALGVPAENTTVVRDAELTLSGMRGALDALDARVLPNDEVFLYYSGHGTRLPVADGRGKGCAEALVTVDGQALLDGEIQDRLQRLAVKARRMVVFLDACHSGGATTRAAGGDAFTAKFWAKTGGETCERPANLLTRGLGEALSGEGKLNYVHIAAARENEVALDDAERGGLATQAWLDCLAGGARDRDGSAGISAAELAACAQPVIDRLARDHSRFSAHHLTLTGNAGMVLARPDAQMAERADPIATLRDIHAGRDPRRLVRLSVDKPAYRVHRDQVGISIHSSHEGYVYLLMVGSDGRSFDLLFPNRKDERNHIRAGESLTLPRAGWAIRAGGPAGRNHLLALVSETPRDFSGLGLRAAGPFSVLAATPAAARDILLVSETSARADAPACAMTSARRTLEVAAACSDAYGADLITLEEIE